MVGPPLVSIVIGEITKRLWEIIIPIQQPGFAEYVVGVTLIVISLVYSGWIHRVDSIAGHRRLAEMPTLDLVFLKINYDEEITEITTSYRYRGRLFQTADPKKIPNFMPKMSVTDFDMYNTNTDISYHRKWYEAMQASGNACRLRCRVTNTGIVSAKNIRVRILFNPENVIKLETARSMPDFPSMHSDFRDRWSHMPYQADVSISGNILEFNKKILNPADSFETQTTVYVRIMESGPVMIEARIFAEDLAEPISKIVTITAEMETVDLTVDDIVTKSTRRRG